MPSLLLIALGVVAALSLAQYLVPHLLLCLLCRDQDLVKRYKAKWGLVTGASSGENCFFPLFSFDHIDGVAFFFPLLNPDLFSLFLFPSTQKESASPWPRSSSPRAPMLSSSPSTTTCSRLPRKSSRLSSQRGK